MKQAIQEYRTITADEKFREMERRREMQRHDEASALGHARREATKQADAKWQHIVLEKDAKLAEKDVKLAEKDMKLSEKDNEIERLRRQLKLLK